MSTPMFTHVGLNCRDMAKTEEFYTRHFGFERARLIPLGDDRIVFLKAGDVYLELFQAVSESANPADVQDGPSFPGVRHIAFKVNDVNAVLQTLGTDVEVTHGPFDFDDIIPGWRTVWVRDPDGRIVELTQGYRDERAD